jgi:hypothetical protein
MRKFLICFMALSISGCATTVQPWEKGNLAKKEMSWDPDGMQSSMNSQVYSSKEASTGGNSSVGGGCGCN